MLNSESEDQSSASTGEDGGDLSDGTSTLAGAGGAGYVAQNSGSDTDADPTSSVGDRVSRLRVGGDGGAGEKERMKSRSRSRGRVPRVETHMNSGSEEDEVEGPAVTKNAERRQGDGGEMRRVIQNEDSETGF
jgi:hypothetical protein